jgi:hypothetical protein
MKVARNVRLPEAEFGTPNLGVQVLWLSAVSCEGRTEGLQEFSNRRPQGLVLLMPYSLIGDGYSDRAQAGTPIRLPIRGAFGCSRW